MLRQPRMSTDDTPQAPPQVIPRSVVAHPRAEPLESSDVIASLRRPERLVDLVLGQPARIGASIARERALAWLSCAMLLTSVAAAIPYGCVLGFEHWWRIVVLYLGTTAICAPSLFMFTSYLGLRRSLSQIVVLAFTLPASAALFTLGFAPILGFLRATMKPESDWIGWRSMSVVMLTLSALAGVAQLWRCLLASRREQDGSGLYFVLIGWHLVLAHVLWRMGGVLGLGA